MTSLNIVLVEPQIPQNTGNIARTCAATGTGLHIVGTMGFRVDDTKLKRAGLDYWHFLNITYYASLEDFFERCLGSYFFFTTKGNTTHSDATYPDNSYLFFGREDGGLPLSLLHSHPENLLRIPMYSQARSLNLSNTVAIAVYEVLRQWDYPTLQGQAKLDEY